MIISKTPFRISLIGGGTDFPEYYKKSPGLVVGGTIDKYCYVSARFLPNVFKYKHRIVWSKIENVRNIKAPKSFHLILGNEANGISEEINNLVTDKVAIKNIGNSAESLNIAVATSILLHEFCN